MATLISKSGNPVWDNGTQNSVMLLQIAVQAAAGDPVAIKAAEVAHFQRMLTLAKLCSSDLGCWIRALTAHGAPP